MTLQMRLFGAFSLTWNTGEQVHVTSAKQRALLAMLVTAPEGRRTRAWLQEALWPRSGPVNGRASLRRALSDLRTLFGDRFETVFEVTNSEITLRPDRVSIVGTPSDGAFLEGIVIREKGFEDWLQSQRRKAA
ncbi:MAG: hypothetical protein HKP40_02810 [Litoreibacter sp.]|nr:hypothetical protein [Litoreibacter sp.]